MHLSETQLERLLSYLDELHLWNRRINLTGLRSRKRMVVELLADSLVPAPHLPASGRLLDVGSGAGLPGIPLKVALPGLEVDLLEPSSKRHHFLKQAIRLMRLDGVRAVRGRLEDSREQLHPEYDVVTSRAVTGLERMIALCAPLVSPGGLLVGFAGRDAGVDARQVPRSLTLERTLPYRLPDTAGTRHALLFRSDLTA